MIKAIFGLISIPIMLLNFGGAIVGAIWLAINGKWALLGLGLGSIAFSSYLISLALVPSMMFIAPAATALDKGRYIIGGVCLAVANLLTVLVMTIWCVVSFNWVLSYHDGGSIWPYLLWGYGVATGPWTFMAARAQSEEVGAAAGAFGACVGAIAMMVVAMSEGNPSVAELAIAFSIPVSIVFLFQLVFSFLLMREQSTV